MKTAAELWADTIKKQPIDDLTIKHTCESLEELINKKTTGVRLAGLLSRAEAIILRQRKEIAALHKAAEVEKVISIADHAAMMDARNLAEEWFS